MALEQNDIENRAVMYKQFEWRFDDPEIASIDVCVQVLEGEGMDDLVRRRIVKYLYSRFAKDLGPIIDGVSINGL